MPIGHTLWILDAETDEVPGTVRLLENQNEPLGVDQLERKRTSDGVILDPQPDDSPDDPLNWASWRRNAALWSLGWHCLVGGGQTPILAAGFEDVANTFGVTIPQVALTTGLYMLGLGIGCVLCSPTAIMFGKRPVYLAGVVLFIASSIWSAASKSYVSLVLARIVMGIGVAPCEALPSATIAEIFFLHERAFRVGVYTLLLLGGKNLVPLVSAVIIDSIGWRWVFWIVAIIVGFNLVLLFFFVPETFWDRTPRPKSAAPSLLRRASSSIFTSRSKGAKSSKSKAAKPGPSNAAAANELNEKPAEDTPAVTTPGADGEKHVMFGEDTHPAAPEPAEDELPEATPAREIYKHATEKTSRESLDRYVRKAALEDVPAPEAVTTTATDAESRTPSPKPFVATLKIYNGKIQRGSWLKSCFRPFVLFAYPAVLWSTVVYSLSVGWLIVLSESVAHIYQDNPYNFSPLGTGLVYLSPFIGGILGTAVAGKVSDVIVRFMTRRNAGIYEPEFRLVMGIPIAISTAIGLMGFGWSAEEENAWIVPTVFFGVISFGCSLGSTTSITFCVDSYRQYAGEALVTLNFSKNVLHGFVFSLFFNHWLEKDGAKTTFVALGVIQMGCLLFTIPLYMYGKRLRMWTVKKNMMAKFT